MNISIICLLYNGERYIEDLYSNILKQKNVDICEIKFVLTESADDSEITLKSLNLNYSTVTKSEFSHSLVREKEALEATGEIVVFITQDIMIYDENWLYELVRGIENDKCDASFSRQIAYDDHTVEKYTREINYPEVSRIVSHDDVKNMGLMTFFFSDSSSAIRKETFVNLGGYDGKNLPTNEDMYLAYKLIMNGYKIKYASKSKVIHSHELSFKDTFNRYVDIGKFFKGNAYLNEYSANERGLDVFRYIIKRIKEEKKLYFLPKVFMNFIARFIGMKIGNIKGEN